MSYTKWLNRGLTGLLVEYRFALQSTTKSSELQTFLFKLQTFDEGGDQVCSFEETLQHTAVQHVHVFVFVVVQNVVAPVKKTSACLIPLTIS